MSLIAATRLGPYEITSAIGAGGAPAAHARREAAERERAGVGSPRALKEATRCAEPPGHRRRILSLLVARQPVHRLLCNRQAEEDRPGRRTAADALRRAAGARRHVERAGGDPVW